MLEVVLTLIKHQGSICNHILILCFTFSRYWAVRHPLKRRLNKRKCIVVIAGIWILAIAIASVQLFVGRSTNQFYGGEYYLDCSEHWPTETYRISYTLFILLATYVIPLIILTFTYSCVGLTLWKHTTPGNADEARDQIQLQSKRKVGRHPIRPVRYRRMALVGGLVCLW